ncbi:hypothetical protein [Saccharopolyspora phatthalungensis]|uniref:Uncharacterized protein n=1 Tax=Saccharopolyspora phatthalungensis TaxID=664693 RepID=A0A840Q5P9_9PSEU|nr:hypothetical protein [Saccharopolyspora phatthalungensis]MBB5153705.1 hypothetical protein [Saccharopolyspora phatthalungensis]
MSDPTRTDCVVDARGEKIIIWHVNTGPAVGLSRLTGAWTFGLDEVDKVKLLVAERRVLMTSAGQEALDQLSIAVPARIAPDVTLDSLRTQRDELQAAYDAQERDDLVAPTWPSLPEPIDMRNPPSAISPEPTQVALALARWLAQVAATWEKIEAQRVVRGYMPGGHKRRPTPIAISKADK